MITLTRRSVLRSTLAVGSAILCASKAERALAASMTLLNVSYDVSREMFAQINPVFRQAWRTRTGQDIVLRQSHGGSSTQARSVAEGLQADVVTLNQVTDVDFLVEAGLVERDWSSRLPNHASPYYSLPIMVVRAGNPRQIKDWDDLAKPGIHPVFPNPKTSGNGRYTYLSAYVFAKARYGGDDAKARAFLGKILSNVPVFDTGGRGATTTFVERGIGDALITFESEVSTIRKQYASTPLEVVYPSVSIRADFPVAVVDKNVERHGTRAAATAYLEFLYSDAAQEILAKNFNRVRNESVLNRYRAQFPDIRLLSVEETFGGWASVMQGHFGEGGVLDQLFATERR